MPVLTGFLYKMRPKKDKFDKKQGYFYHAWSRVFSRYFFAIDKAGMKRIVEALHTPDPYLPVKLLKEWENRSKWEIIYMGRPMKIIYDKPTECIVTFLPYEERETSSNAA